MIKKYEMIAVFREIMDLLEGTADPYATESEVMAQIRSKVEEVLGEDGQGKS